MTTFRTTARLGLAALALAFGAGFAAAKDKTPAKPDRKPHAAPVAKHAAPAVQPHTPPSPTEKRVREPIKLTKPPAAYQQGDTLTHEVRKVAPEAKKPNNFSFGAQPTKGVKEAAKSGK